MNKKNATDNLLIYNQVMFNIYELYARKLREEFYNTDFEVNDYKEKFQIMSEKINSDLKNRLENYRSDADLGNNFAGVKVWELKINQELEELKTYKVEYR